MRLTQAIQVLADFCGPRDLTSLNRQDLMAQHGLDQVDICVLFGGSILAGGDVLAQAMQAQLAKHYLIVGGVGHTTDGLRAQFAAQFPDLAVEQLTEAELFAHYLKTTHGLSVDALETRSTNCGNNISFLLELVRDKGLPCRSILLMQDATMQRRMAATLARQAQGVTILNYATYQVEVVEQAGELVYDHQPLGMWKMSRYLNLLLGEIPRLRDDQEGYGPKGQDYLVHVDIPDQVEAAWQEVQAQTGLSSRQADSAHAGPQS